MSEEQSAPPNGHMPWHSMDDVRRDVRRYAEFVFAAGGSSACAHDVRRPDTLVRHDELIRQNRRTRLCSDPEAEAAAEAEAERLLEERRRRHVHKGRGRGICIASPEQAAAWESMEADMELAKQIREASGLGYSNELIEQSIEANSYKDTLHSEGSLCLSSCSDTPSSSGAKTKKEKRKSQSKTKENV